MGMILGGRERRAAGMTFPEPIIPPYPGADTGGRVSVAAQPALALQVPTVWACVGLLANTISTMPLETFRRTGGVPLRIKDPIVVVEPAAGMSQSEWVHALVVSLLLRGNAYARIANRAEDTRPTQLELLNPDRMTPKVEDDGSVSYRYGGKPIVATDIWHVRGLTMPGSKIGLSPIAYAAATLGVDLSSRRFAGDYFDGGGIPKAVIQSDQQINQQQARTIKDRFLSAARNREVVTLGDGIKYTPIQVKPEESQFLATQQANVAQIARYFWIPPEMVGGSGGNSMTYANVEQRSLDFLTYAVSFWLKRIEDAFFPLLPAPQFVRFNESALLRTDMETQAKIQVLQIAGKYRTRDEVRADLNLAPLTPEQVADTDAVGLTVSPTGRPITAPPAANPSAGPTQGAPDAGT